MALPTTLTNFQYASDGIEWCGPFISSGGNVYVVGFANTGTASYITAYKATDPTSSFTQFNGVDKLGQTLRTLSTHQAGDVIHCVYATTSTDALIYVTFNMATDTWATEVSQAVTAPDGWGAALAKRSTGSDIIVFYNMPAVTNMGKDYPRIAARRIAGGTTWGAQTDIGIGTAATTAQSESVEAVCLGSSDRVHLFYTKSNATDASGAQFDQRTVKSTDNLDGTGPATAGQVIVDPIQSTTAANKQGHLVGQVFKSSADVLCAAYVQSTTPGLVDIRTATSADTPTWSGSTTVSAAAARTGIVGNTDVVARIGGSPYDGTAKNVAWIDNATTDPMYDKDTFGTDQTIEATTAAQINANVLTRGSNVVLAVVYDKSGVWVYNEVILRTTGTTVGPVNAVAGTGTVRTVTLVSPSNVAVSRVIGTGTVQSVAAVTGTSVSATPVVGTGTVRAVTIAASANAAPPTIAATGTVQSTTVAASASTAPAVVAGTGTVRTVTVSAGGGTDVPVSTVVGTGTVRTVAISASATATPSTVVGTGTVRTVTISAAATATPAKVSGTGTVRSVTLSINEVATHTPIAGVGTVRTVTINTGGGAPSSAAVGMPAWRMVGWGSPAWWFMSSAQYATEHGRGWGGNSVGMQHMGGSTGLGGSYAFKGTTASGDSDAGPYLYQRMIEGLSPENAFLTPVAYALTNAMTSGIGFYTKQDAQDLDNPPLGGDWTNTTNRTNIANYLADVAAFITFIGMNEIHFDIEHNGSGWGIGAPTATRQNVFDFGKALGQAVYTVAPAIDTAVYSWYSTDGWDGEVQYVSSGGSTPRNYALGATWDDFFCGWMEGMRLAGGTGYVYNLDAKWYRTAGNYVSGAVDRAAYKLDVERAMAQLSRLCKPGNGESRPWASEALAAYVLSHYRAAAFIWRGTDGTGFYDGTQPDDTTWSIQRSDARLDAMGPKMWEYNGPQGGSPPDEAFYSNSGWITGAQAGANATAISTSVPTISSVTQNDNGGGSFTITCRAAHLYGVSRVDIYLGATKLQTMAMTFVPNGGTVTTDYDNSYQDCTATLTGRSGGDGLTLVAYTAKDDRGTAALTLSGGGGATATPATVAGVGTVRAVTVLGDFNPMSLGTMQAWIDPSNTASITHASNAVSQIDDLTGNGAHGTQSVAGNKPTTNTRQIGLLNALDFDGGDFLNLPGVSASDRSQTLFFVVQLDSLNGSGGATTSSCPIGPTGAGGRHVSFFGETGGNGGLLTLISSNVAVLAEYNTPGVPSTGVTYVCMMVISDTNVIFRINNFAEETDADSTTFTASLTTLLGADADINYSLDGALGEVWIYDGQMGATNRGIAMTQLINKWAPTGTNVPASTVAGTGTVRAVTISTNMVASPTPVVGTGTVRAVTISTSVAAAPATIAGTGTVRTVAISTTAVTSPATVAGTGTVRSVVVSTSVSAAPAVVAGTGTVRAVAISIGTNVSVSTVVGTGTTRGVTISATATAAPAAVQGVGTVQAVVGSVSVVAAPTTVVGTGTVQAVTVSTAAGATTTPATVVGTGAVRSVTITATANAAVSAVVGTGTAQAVVISAGATTTVSVVAGTGTVRTVAVSAAATAVPNAITGTGTVQPVTVSTGASATATPGVIVGTGTVQSVSVSATSNLTVSTVAGVGTVRAVTITAVPNLAISTVAGVGTVQAVAIQATATAAVAAIAGVGTVQSATVQTGSNTTVPVAQVVGTGAVRSVVMSASAAAQAAVVVGVGMVRFGEMQISVSVAVPVIVGTGQVRGVVLVTLIIAADSWARVIGARFTAVQVLGDSTVRAQVLDSVVTAGRIP